MAWVSNFSWLNHLALHEERLRGYLNSTEDYLTFLCGPRRSHLFLPMALVYSLIFVVGVVGNFLVCLVILKHRNMKTPTNYYLFSLAVSDLLVLLLGMPLEVYEMWSNYPFLLGPVGCYLKTALLETVCLASILSVTALSVERYIAVLHPFRAKLGSTRRRALRTILALWGLSVLFALPNTGTHGIVQQRFPNGTLLPGSATCAVVAPLWIYNCIVQVTSLLFYVLPMAVISVLYCLMGLRVSPAPAALSALLGSFLCVCVCVWLLSGFRGFFLPICFSSPKKAKVFLKPLKTLDPTPSLVQSHPEINIAMLGSNLPQSSYKNLSALLLTSEC